MVEIGHHPLLVEGGAHERELVLYADTVCSADPLRAQPGGLHLEQSADVVDVHQLGKGQALDHSPLVR